MHARKARKSVLEAFFKAHNLRSTKLIATRIEAIKASKPLTQDIAVITSHRLLAQVLVEQIRITLQAIDRFDQEIAVLAPTLPDYMFSVICLVPVKLWRPACLSPLVNNVNAIQLPVNCKCIRVLRQSLKEVVKKAGYIGGCGVRSL